MNTWDSSGKGGEESSLLTVYYRPNVMSKVLNLHLDVSGREVPLHTQNPKVHHDTARCWPEAEPKL